MSHEELILIKYMDEMERAMKTKWIPISLMTPPENKIVNTKISDSAGERNIQKLQRKGNLWFSPDGTNYVYYTPTHWEYEHK